ncbi:MAG: hypothetical protein AAF449_12560, partial [Myxococcota bacterium]
MPHRLVARCIWAYAMLATVFGCADDAVVQAEVPEDVAYVAILELAEDGQLRQASDLTPWTPSLPVVSDASTTTLVVGYTERQLAPFGADIGALGPIPLTTATGCAPALPVPAYAARLDDQRLQAFAADAVPPITAPLARQGCEGLAERNWAVDATNGSQRCDVAVFSRNACQVRLQLDGCDDRAFVVTQNPIDGSFCGETEGGLACVSTPDPHAPISLNCGADGRFHIYPDATNVEPPFALDRVRFRDEPFFAPSTAQNTPWVHVRFLRSSYGIAMALLRDRVIISSPLDPADRCGLSPSAFYSIDPDTLQVFHVESGRACARPLSVDPGGETFLAIFHDGQTWRIGRFDADGRLLADQAVVTEPYSGINDWRPQAILRPPGTADVWVLFNFRREIAPLPANILVRVNSTSLAVMPPDVLPTWQRTFAAAVLDGDPTCAFVSEWEPTVGWFAPNGLDYPSPLDAIRIELDSPLVNHY